VARNIVLHIGVPKTGSTTIQKFLTENSGRLPAMGYAYLKSLGQPNNTGLVLHCRNFGRAASERRTLRYRKGIRTESDLSAYRSKLERALASEIAALPPSLGTIVMSARPSGACFAISLDIKGVELGSASPARKRAGFESAPSWSGEGPFTLAKAAYPAA